MIRFVPIACLLAATPAIAEQMPASSQQLAPAKRSMKLHLDMKAIKLIPLQRVKGAIILPAVIAGRKINILFDNGSDATMIDQTLAREVGLPLTDSGLKMNTGISIMPTQLTTTELRVGDDLTINGQVITTDLGGMSRALGMPIGGVLGADAMAPFIIVVNPQKAWVAFSLPGYIDVSGKTTIAGEMGAQGAAALKAKDGEGVKAVAAQVAARSASKSIPLGPDFTLNATINGKAVNLKIDYGMVGAVALRDDVWQRVIPPEARSAEPVTYARADGLQGKGQMGKADLDIAGVRVKDMPVTSRNFGDKLKEGMLGLSVLASTTTVIDMPKRQLWLFPPDQEVSVSISARKADTTEGETKAN